MRLKVDIAKTIASETAFSEAERSKAKDKYIVGLNPSNLGLIIFGKLASDSYAAPDAPLVKAFTKEKIPEAHRKVHPVKFVICHTVISSRKFAQENMINDQQNCNNTEDKTTMMLFEKADQAYLSVKDSGSMLTRLDASDLKDIVLFLCHIKKTPGDTFSKHNMSKRKMQEQIILNKPLCLSLSPPPPPTLRIPRRRNRTLTRTMH